MGNTITVDLPEGLTEADIIVLNKGEAMQMMAQNDELKADVAALVGVFGQFAGLFTGKSIISAAPTIMKLLKDTEKLESIGAIVPIIEKYTSHAKAIENE